MIDFRVHRNARLGRGVRPGAFTVVDEGSIVEEGAIVGALVYIGPGLTIGANAEIGAHAVILTDVPAGAVVEPATVWTGESKAGALEVLESAVESIVKPKRGRAKKEPAEDA